MTLSDLDRADFTLRGLPIEDAPTQWESGPVTWAGRHDVEPLAPDVAYGQNMRMPGSVAFRFRGEHGAPSIEARVDVVHGIPELTHFEMTATATGGVRTSDLRNVMVDGLVLGIAEATAERVSSVGEGVVELTAPAPREAEREAVRARRGRGPTGARTGRRPVSVERIRYAAKVYQDHLQSNPRQAVMDRLGVSGSTADRYIAQARGAGFLPATSPGKVRG